jgi:hypothetical protein
MHCIEGAQDMLSRHRVEQTTNLVITGNALNTEQAGGLQLINVTATACYG